MTLIFKVDLDINRLHHHTKFCGPKSNGSGAKVWKHVLGHWKKQTKNKKQKTKNQLHQNLKAVLCTGLISHTITYSALSWLQSAGVLRIAQNLELEEDTSPSEPNLSFLCITCGWAEDVVNSWVEQARPRSKEEILSRPAPLNTKTGRKPAYFCEYLVACKIIAVFLLSTR